MQYNTNNLHWIPWDLCSEDFSRKAVMIISGCVAMGFFCSKKTFEKFIAFLQANLGTAILKWVLLVEGSVLPMKKRVQHYSWHGTHLPGSKSHWVQQNWIPNNCSQDCSLTVQTGLSTQTQAPHISVGYAEVWQVVFYFLVCVQKLVFLAREAWTSFSQTCLGWLCYCGTMEVWADIACKVLITV